MCSYLSTPLQREALALCQDPKICHEVQQFLLQPARLTQQADRAHLLESPSPLAEAQCKWDQPGTSQRKCDTADNLNLLVNSQYKPGLGTPFSFRRMEHECGVNATILRKNKIYLRLISRIIACQATNVRIPSNWLSAPPADPHVSTWAGLLQCCTSISGPQTFQQN